MLSEMKEILCKLLKLKKAGCRKICEYNPVYVKIQKALMYIYISICKT